MQTSVYAIVSILHTESSIHMYIKYICKAPACNQSHPFIASLAGLMEKVGIGTMASDTRPFHRVYIRDPGKSVPPTTTGFKPF